MYNSREAWHTSSAMVPGTFNCSCWAGRGYSRMLPSASSMMRAIMLTASIGYFPVAVSAESITASDPSKIALATSEASARVGRGFSVIDSSIWVAVITGRRSSLAHEDRLHLLGLHTRALQRRLYGARPQTGSRQARQRSLERADGRPRGADDHDFLHLP